MANPTGLGRGLGSLIPTKPKPQASMNTIADDSNNSSTQVIKDLPIDSISANPMQPRKIFSHQDLEDLVNSISRYGIIQPLTVTKSGENSYELIAGERRLRASKIAGLKTVPAIIRDAGELEKLELAIIENIQRQDLNPIEKADSYYRLMDEFSLTQEDAAKRLGIQRSTLANTVRLLTLSPDIQKALADGKITSGHARAILSLPTPSEQQKFFKKIMESGMNVRDAESASRVINKKPLRNIATDPNIESHKNTLQAALGTKVYINSKGEGGNITIHYYSPEELQNIINTISKP